MCKTWLVAVAVAVSFASCRQNRAPASATEVICGADGAPEGPPPPVGVELELDDPVPSGPDLFNQRNPIVACGEEVCLVSWQDKTPRIARFRASDATPIDPLIGVEYPGGRPIAGTEGNFLALSALDGGVQAAVVHTQGSMRVDAPFTIAASANCPDADFDPTFRTSRT